MNYKSEYIFDKGQPDSKWKILTNYRTSCVDLKKTCKHCIDIEKYCDNLGILYYYVYPAIIVCYDVFEDGATILCLDCLLESLKSLKNRDNIDSDLCKIIDKYIG